MENRKLKGTRGERVSKASSVPVGNKILLFYHLRPGSFLFAVASGRHKGTQAEEASCFPAACLLCFMSFSRWACCAIKAASPLPGKAGRGFRPVVAKRLPGGRINPAFFCLWNFAGWRGLFSIRLHKIKKRVFKGCFFPTVRGIYARAIR
jgi:hypothetical protein